MKKILILTALLFASCSDSGFERNARTIEEMKQCEEAGLVRLRMERALFRAILATFPLLI